MHSTYRHTAGNVLPLHIVINLLSSLLLSNSLAFFKLSSSGPRDRHREGGQGRKEKKKKKKLMGLEEWVKGSMKGEGFAWYCALPASPCNSRIDSRCQNDKQMDYHNHINMQGIQKHSYGCIIFGPFLSANPRLQTNNSSVSDEFLVSTLIKVLIQKCTTHLHVHTHTHVTISSIPLPFLQSIHFACIECVNHYKVNP